MTSKKILHLTE